MKNSEVKPWGTLKQAQAATGFSLYALRMWANNGMIRACKSGNTTYVYLPSLLDPEFQPGKVVINEVNPE